MNMFKDSGLKVFHICKRYASYDDNPTMWCGEVLEMPHGPFFQNVEEALRECRGTGLSACSGCVSELSGL